MRYSLNALYQQAGLSKQSVNQHFHKQSRWEEQLADLLEEVEEWRAVHGGCGLEKLYYSLQPDFLGRDRFIRVLQAAGYSVKQVKNYTRTTIPGHYKYPNLIQGSLVTAINQVWQSDITYILIGEKFFYLVFILDVYSRRIIGWAASDHLRATANIQALKMAFKCRLGTLLDGLIHHSDRGSQYIAGSYVALLKKRSIAISMGTKGMQNAYVERVNGTIKNEYLAYQSIKDLKSLKRKLKQDIDHYNEQRIHDHLPRRMSPVQFENSGQSNTTEQYAYLIYCEDKPELKTTNKWLIFSAAEDLGLHSCRINYSMDYLT